MSLIMGQVIPDQSVLSALEIEKLNFNNLIGIYFCCSPVLLNTQVSDIGPSWSSCFPERRLVPSLFKKKGQNNN